MGPAQLAGVLSIVARAVGGGARARSSTRRATQGMREIVEAQIEEQSLPYFLSGMLYDDGVIDPRDTRTVLGICLSVIENKAVRRHRPVRGVPAVITRDCWSPTGPRSRRRVFRTCRTLGIETVAIHSDADAGLPYVREADVAVRLPGNAPAETYLDVDRRAGGGRGRPAPTRSTPATGSSPRTPTSPAP